MAIDSNDEWQQIKGIWPNKKKVTENIWSKNSFETLYDI